MYVQRVRLNFHGGHFLFASPSLGWVRLGRAATDGAVVSTRTVPLRCGFREHESIAHKKKKGKKAVGRRIIVPWTLFRRRWTRTWTWPWSRGPCAGWTWSTRRTADNTSADSRPCPCNWRFPRGEVPWCLEKRKVQTCNIRVTDEKKHPPLTRSYEELVRAPVVRA